MTPRCGLATTQTSAIRIKLAGTQNTRSAAVIATTIRPARVQRTLYSEADQFAGAAAGPTTSMARGPMSGAPKALHDPSPVHDTTVAFGHWPGYVAGTGTDIEIHRLKWPACWGATT